MRATLENALRTHARYYGHLDPSSQKRARTFFESRNAEQPHLAWMEIVFLQTLHMIAKQQMVSKVAADKIAVASPTDARYFDHYADFAEREDHYREVGKVALQNGELMAIDLVAGMATGFGGTAKGAVDAIADVRYERERSFTYLDIKRGNYLTLQRESGRHLIAAAMVSSETEKSILEKLRKFAEENEMELVLIRDGESRENIQGTWQKYKDRWREVIIVPIIRQPSTLYISRDGKKVGRPYMKGHGDFYDVVQSQLRDLMEIAGIKYVFSSNIDNTGAVVSRSILGYFIEQVQRRQIEAIMEAAEKFEGDKGGVPALIDSTFALLEEAFVPEEWKDRFLGREVFPFFNTNNLWYTARALLEGDFSLPLLVSKEIREGDETWLKIENAMGQGLTSLVWKALVIDRGLRFLPAKYLTDLWIGRTDWIKLFEGRLMQAMHDGKYIPKPLVAVSNKIFSSVADLNGAIFGRGAYDSMRRLQTMAMGGEGRNFHLTGSYLTRCGVAYEGDNAVVFGYRQGLATGTLIVAGASEADEIGLANSLIYVPPGETVTIRKSVQGQRDPYFTEDRLRAFLANTEDRWPASQRVRVLENFFPRHAAEIRDIPFTFDDILTERYLSQLDPQHQAELHDLRSIFKIQGSLVYQVEFREEAPGKEPHPYLIVKEGSKKGTAERDQYPSQADGKYNRASGHKANTICRVPGPIFVDKINPADKGPAFAGKHYIAVPNHRGREIILLIGEFDESFNGRAKETVFGERIPAMIKFAGDDGFADNEETRARVTEAFRRIPWSAFYTQSKHELYTNYIRPKITTGETGGGHHG